MLVTASHQTGQDVFISFDKEELKLIPKVANHPIFNDEANWVMVSIVYKHNSSDKRLVSGFKNDFTKTDNVKVKPDMVMGEVYELHEIIVSGTDRQPILSIKRNEIDNASSMDFTLGGGDYIPVVLRTDSPPWRTYFPSGADTYFYVTVEFNEQVDGFTAEKLNIVNGQIEYIEYVDFANSYTVKINPVGAGILTVQFPKNSVTSSADGKYNSDSNIISVEFIEAITVSAYSPDVDEQGKVYDEFDVILSYSQPVFLLESMNQLNEFSIQIENSIQMGITISNFEIVSAITWVEEIVPYATTFKFRVSCQSPGQIILFLNQGVGTTEKNITHEGGSIFIANCYRKPHPTLTTPSLNVNGNFVVTATFDQDVFGFTASDVLITNGTIVSFDPAEYDENGQPVGESFTFTISPIAEGVVTVYIPGNVSIGAFGGPNSPSNQLDVVYAIEGYRYYKFGFRDGWSSTDTSTSSFSMRSNSIALSDIKMTWDGKVQNMIGATLTYLVNPTKGTGNLIDGVTCSSYGFTNQYRQWENLNTSTYTDLFKIDLKEKKNVTSIHFAPVKDYFFPRTFKIYGSNDDINWEDVLSVDEKSNNWAKYPSYKEYITKPQTAENIMISNGIPKLEGISFRYVKMSVKHVWATPTQTSLYNPNLNLPDLYNKVDVPQINFVWDGEVHNLQDLGATQNIIGQIEPYNFFGFTAPPANVINGSGRNVFMNLNTNIYNDLFVVDLLSPRDIEYVLIANSPSQIPKAFKIYGSNDNSTWTEILSIDESTYKWGFGGYRIFGSDNPASSSLLWSSPSNWTSELVPNSSTAWANIYGQVDLGNHYNPDKSIYLDTDIYLNKLEISGPTNSWSIKDGGYSKSITLSGSNPKINFESISANHFIEVPVNAYGFGSFTIEGAASGTCTISGLLTTSSNRNISINMTHPNSSLILNNNYNDITGTISINSVKTALKSFDSEECKINWSNKIGNVSNTTIFDGVDNWGGEINFLSDGSKKYMIGGENQTIYTGALKGIVSNSLQFKNCTLNQSSNSLSFSTDSNIVVSSGTLEWNNLNALPSTATLQLFNNRGAPSIGTDEPANVIVKFPENCTISNPIKYDGTPMSSILEVVKTAKLMLKNTVLSGNISFRSAWYESPLLICSITMVGTGTFSGNILGKAYSAGIAIGDGTINDSTVINFTGNSTPEFGGNLSIVSGILNFNGTFGTATTVGSKGKLFGTGTINKVWSSQNVILSIESGGIVCPENYNTPGTSQYLTIGGKTSLAGNLKIRFGSSGDCTKLVVNGDAILGGTISVQAGSIVSGQTYTVLQYSGTRTGTFTTNALGAGTNIVYDDANKRVLVTKA